MNEGAKEANQANKDFRDRQHQQQIEEKLTTIIELLKLVIDRRFRDGN